jgi:RimJ/RimL family protein N-acetyltransferase
MVRLENMEYMDLKKIIEWNEGMTSDYLLQWAGPKYNHPLTLTQIENYFLNEVSKDGSNIVIYKIISINTNEIIGTIELRETDKVNKVGRIGRFLIGEQSMRGKGIGKFVMREVLKKGFEDLGFQKITLGVFDSNHSAIKCYENAGFIKERLIENARKAAGGYWNLYEMSILKDYYTNKCK